MKQPQPTNEPEILPCPHCMRQPLAMELGINKAPITCINKRCLAKPRATEKNMTAAANQWNFMHWGDILVHPPAEPKVLPV